MHFDFSSAIDNARFFAARDEAQRRHAGPRVDPDQKSGQWSALPARVRPAEHGRGSSGSLHPVKAATHAH